MSQPDLSKPAAAAPRSRRGFFRVAGIAFTGGTALTALGPPGQAAAETHVAAGSASSMGVARRRAYGALTEAVASLRGTGSETGRSRAAVGAAHGKLAAWYAAASPAERLQVDGTLDVIEQAFAPGAFASHTVRRRLRLLAEQLNGRHEAQLTTAIGLAVVGLNKSYSGPAQAQAAGRLYARMIRALPAQRDPARVPSVRQAADGGAACAPNVRSI